MSCRRQPIVRPRNRCFSGNRPRRIKADSSHLWRRVRGLGGTTPGAGKFKSPPIADAHVLDPGLDPRAKKLFDWVRRKGLTEFTKKQVMQLGPGSVRKAEVAKTALLTLIEHGLLTTDDSSNYRVADIALPSSNGERLSA